MKKRCKKSKRIPKKGYQGKYDILDNQHHIPEELEQLLYVLPKNVTHHEFKEETIISKTDINKIINTSFNQKCKNNNINANDLIISEIINEINIYDKLFEEKQHVQRPISNRRFITDIKKYQLFVKNVKKDHRFNSIDSFFDDAFRRYDNLIIKPTTKTIEDHEYIKGSKYEIHVEAKLADSVTKLMKQHGINLNILTNYIIDEYNEEMKNYEPIKTNTKNLILDKELHDKWKYYLKVVPDYKYCRLGYSKQRLAIERIMIKYITNGYDTLFPQYNKLHHSEELIKEESLSYIIDAYP